MESIERRDLFSALCQHGGLWALEQVELLARLRGEPNTHKMLVPKRRWKGLPRRRVFP